MAEARECGPELARGLQLQQAGRLTEAAAVYAGILDRDASCADAHHLLGVVAWMDGRAGDAVESLRRAIALNPSEWAYHVNLGNALEAAGDSVAAAASLRNAIRVDPTRVEGLCNLGGVLGRAGDLEGAIEAYSAARRIDPRRPEPHQGLSWALATAGRAEEISSLAQAWYDAAPEDPVARHLACASRLGAGSTDLEFTRTYFDRFGGTYDAVMRGVEAEGPARIEAALLQSIGPAAGDLDVLDAGCGTGCMAVILRPWARRLCGIDLSAEMIARAPHETYDALTVGEIGEVLATSEERYDVVVASDVLAYVGDLRPIVGALLGALRPGGMLACTLERTDDGSAWRLQPSGRWAHGEAHVRASVAGLEPQIERLVLRREAGRPVDGLLVTARKPK